MKRVLAKAAERAIHRCAIAFGASDVERDEAGVPTAFLMWKPGVNRTDHGDHVLTEESLSKITSDQASRGNLFSIDVDHMSLNDQAPPENHKAVGWFRVEARAGALWAVDVKWTDAVRAGFTKDTPEWRYFSPAYETTKKTGEIVRLLNCALTNNPATHNVTALATSAPAKETAMEEYDKMTLAALLAAMEDEKDEAKRAAMDKCVRAKFKAAFPDASDEKKDEPKKEETKASEEPKAAEEPKKEETKASEDEEKKAESIAAKAESKFVARIREREEKAAIDKILAALPAGDRETYKDLSLVQLERVVKRHHADVLQHFAAAGSVQPVRGAEQRTSMLPEKERAELDDLMGITASKPFIEEKGTMLSINPLATPADAEKFLASLASESTKTKTSGEALSRILATQKGAA